MFRIRIRLQFTVHDHIGAYNISLYIYMCIYIYIYRGLPFCPSGSKSLSGISVVFMVRSIDYYDMAGVQIFLRWVVP